MRFKTSQTPYENQSKALTKPTLHLIAGPTASGKSALALEIARRERGTIINADMRFSPVYFRTLLEQDAKAFGIAAPAWDEFTQPSPYFDELKSKQRLRVKVPIETSHLRISLDIGKATSIIEGHQRWW